MKKTFLSIFLFSLFITSSVVFVPNTSAQESTPTSAVTREQPSPTPSPTPTPVPPPENPINLTLSPITLQIDVKPGETQSYEIKIRNNGTEVEPLEVSFATFGFDEETQQIDLNQQETGEHMDWLTVDQPRFSVNPGEWKTITATYAPPANAALSYYYAIIFKRQAQKNPDNSTTAVSGAPAILVLSHIDSPLTNRELQVDSFSVPKFWVEFLPQTFVLRIRNTGNVHVRPYGNIFIDGQGKKDIAILSINEGGNQILPNTAREFSIPWSDGFPFWREKMEKEQVVLDEQGNTIQELHWDFSQVDRFRFGKYTAHLLLVYDNGERDIPVESYISFWVIPWRICLALLVILLFVLLGVRATALTIYKSFKKPPLPPSPQP